ncbi:VOC family protein [Actinomadura sp. ATCC 31491]|uniref:VOC family protein n=1 Tax=Actinomadura luzonensis TaxID=2805427 RepID=A0ABT0FNB2_9ACTN|nr:VOC family protein [Actinomadura luzonensis]MCK2213835.1 VOC family protein [Actinomadura luzonensis]
MISLFRSLHHVCVVVADLDQAVAYYESLGVGPWYDYPKGGPYETYEVPNPVASAAMRYKCADLDNVQLQLCQPPAGLDSPQRRFLEECGEGVYHLGFESPDLGAAEERARTLGVDVLARGRRADGSGFCYFDTRARAGVTLEIRRTQHDAG